MLDDTDYCYIGLADLADLAFSVHDTRKLNLAIR